MSNPKPSPFPSPKPPKSLGSLAGMAEGAKRYFKAKYADDYAKYMQNMTKYNNYKEAMKEYKKLGGNNG
jgi:hypothetical protein